MREYIISEATIAILPLTEKSSLVLEEGKEQFKVLRSPNSIINRNCLFNGSNIETRLKSTKLLTGYRYKAPILINEEKKVIFFPTSSPRLKDVAWLNINKVENYFYSKTKKKTIIQFCDGRTLETKVSLGIINNQVLHATRLSIKIATKSFHEL